MNKKKNKKTWKKIVGIGALIVAVSGSIVASIVLGLKNDEVSLILSLLCSLLSIILSVVALWYTYKSGIAMDAQFDELKILIKQMREVQHELDTSINQLAQIEDELSPELKAKIDEFKADLSADSSTFFDLKE